MSWWPVRTVVLSSAYLRGLRQVSRAWKLSTELVFELEMAGPHLGPSAADWGTDDPVELARTVRAAGPDHLVVSPREVEPDWGIVRSIAALGPTWVDGSFSVTEAPRLTEAGATEGHLSPRRPLHPLGRLGGSDFAGSQDSPGLTAR